MARSLTNQFVAKQLDAGRYYDLVKGFHLYVKEGGKKYWVFRFSRNRKRSDLGLGPYPEVSLADARARAMEYRRMLFKGEIPSSSRAARAESTELIEINFSEFAEEYIRSNEVQWKNPKHIQQWRNTLATYVYPFIGTKALNSINTEDMLRILNPIWVAKTETASRVRGRVEKILSAAITRQLRSGPNPATWNGHIENLLPKPSKIKKVKHHAAIPYSSMAGLLAILKTKDCVSALALQFLILTAARTGEVIKARWSEVHNDLWVIPAERMKAGREHRVPLTESAVMILKMAKSIWGESEFIFHNAGKPMSGAAMSALLERVAPGYTIHGFRSSFRDWVAEETEFSGELAEMALAHTIKNQVEASYRRGDLLSRRRVLMNAWALFCDGVFVEQSNVLQIRRAA